MTYYAGKLKHQSVHSLGRLEVAKIQTLKIGQDRGTRTADASSGVSTVTISNDKITDEY